MIELTLRITPTGATRWLIRSTRSMDLETGFLQATIRRMWNALQLRPHRSETFTLSSDRRSVDKVCGIVWLYLSPPPRAINLSVDEKSRIQALEHEKPVHSTMSGNPERRTHGYVRHGTTSLVAAFHIASGFVIGKGYKRQHATEFLDFLRQIDRSVPDCLDIDRRPSDRARARRRRLAHVAEVVKPVDSPEHVVGGRMIVELKLD